MVEIIYNFWLGITNHEHIVFQNAEKQRKRHSGDCNKRDYKQ